MLNGASQQLFTDDEFKKNSELREELFKLISSGDAILFVGSGMSMSVGFPSWDGLLRQLESLALKIGTGFTVDDNLRVSDPVFGAKVTSNQPKMQPLIHPVSKTPHQLS